MSFHDHFSKQANDYVRYRPDYPRELYQLILDKTEGRSCAWDCATGNGQAAVALAEYFDHVEATDASQSQIDHARLHPKVHYRQSISEQTVFPDHHFDLITVAQALHWFQLDAFWKEAQRLLKPNGRLAVWGYSLPEFDPAIDQAMWHFYRDIVGSYWPPERGHVENQYETIRFPGKVNSFEIYLEKTWTNAELLGYFSTWSATQAYIAQQQQNPIALIKKTMTKAWDSRPNVIGRQPIFLKLLQF